MNRWPLFEVVMYGAPYTRTIEPTPAPIPFPKTAQEMIGICQRVMDEFDVMRAVESLPRDAQVRVLDWLQRKLGQP